MQNEIDFLTLIYSFATSAMINLGKVPPAPGAKLGEVNLTVAKQNIDILGMLKEKTKGNLTEDETKMLEQFLSELRLLYVEMTSKK